MIALCSQSSSGSSKRQKTARKGKKSKIEQQFADTEMDVDDQDKDKKVFFQLRMKITNIWKTAIAKLLVLNSFVVQYGLFKISLLTDRTYKENDDDDNDS